MSVKDASHGWWTIYLIGSRSCKPSPVTILSGRTSILRPACRVGSALGRCRQSLLPSALERIKEPPPANGSKTCPAKESSRDKKRSQSSRHFGPEGLRMSSQKVELGKYLIRARRWRVHF